MCSRLKEDPTRNRAESPRCVLAFQHAPSFSFFSFSLPSALGNSLVTLREKNIIEYTGNAIASQHRIFSNVLSSIGTRLVIAFLSLPLALFIFLFFYSVQTSRPRLLRTS